MNLKAVKSDSIVAVDANILVYATRNNSAQCADFLKRCGNGEVTAIVSTHVLAEVMHVLMIAEARDSKGISGSNPARQLAEKPEQARMLHRYEKAMYELLAANIGIEPIIERDFTTALSIQRQSGLLTNDALLVAAARRLGIDCIASADDAFARVPDFQVFRPDDLRF